MGLIGTTGKVEADPVAPLLRIYRAKLFDISQRLRAGELLPDSYLARQIGPILRELKLLDVEAHKWAQKMVRETYPKGLTAAAAELRAAGVGAVGAGFGDFDQRAASALIARTSANLGYIRETLVEGLLGGENPNTASAVRKMREALAGDNQLVDLGKRGLRVATPSGRKWDPNKYARMLGRTATSDARRVAQRARYLQNGVDVVVVVANGTNHDVCAAWEGRQLSLTGATKGIPTVADARAAGLWHPNCAHRYYADSSAEQPGGDLTSPDDPNYSTLGQFQAEPSRAQARSTAGAAAAVLAAGRAAPRYVPQRKIADAASWGKENRTFQVAGRKMKLSEWNAVNEDVGKITPRAMERLTETGTTIELVVGKGIPKHPKLAHLKGKRPRGWTEGSTWDDVPGAGPGSRNGQVVIAANKLKEGHGSQNLILHEVGHGLDVHELSTADDWQKIWKSEEWWDAYTADYPEEAFAESFAKFFDGVQSRAELPESVRRYMAERYE